MTEQKKRIRGPQGILIRYQVPRPAYAKLKLVAAAERRAINAMGRELMLQSLDEAMNAPKARNRPTRADREFPAVPGINE
jgi:hypothetical protein